MTDRTWTRDAAEVFAFARDITLGLRLDGQAVLEIFEHPWAFAREHEWWEANGRPDDSDRWVDGQLEGYETRNAA